MSQKITTGHFCCQLPHPRHPSSLQLPNAPAPPQPELASPAFSWAVGASSPQHTAAYHPDATSTHSPLLPPPHLPPPPPCPPPAPPTPPVLSHPASALHISVPCHTFFLLCHHLFLPHHCSPPIACSFLCKSQTNIFFIFFESAPLFIFVHLLLSLQCSCSLLNTLVEQLLTAHDV